MIYCFDIDGTICSKVKNADYPSALPLQSRIVHVNKLYAEGHTIIFFTARGSTTGIDWRHLTESQLSSWGVNYHQLILGKPEADIYVDDRGIKDTSYFEDDYCE